MERGEGWDRRWVKSDSRPLRKKIRVAAEYLFFFLAVEAEVEPFALPCPCMDHPEGAVSARASMPAERGLLPAARARDIQRELSAGLDIQARPFALAINHHDSSGLQTTTRGARPHSSSPLRNNTGQLGGSSGLPFHHADPRIRGFPRQEADRASNL